MYDPAAELPPELEAVDALIRRALSDPEARARLARTLFQISDDESAAESTGPTSDDEDRNERLEQE